MLPCLAGMLLAAVPPAASLAGEPGGDLQAARAVVSRVLPALAGQIHLTREDSAGGPERAHVGGSRGDITVRGTSDSALLFGLDWYLQYVAGLQISTSGRQLGAVSVLPAPPPALDLSAVYPVRYALNENTDGYTSPYWNWERWQREIDTYALAGIDMMLVERGADTVLHRTFRRLGYPEPAIRRWLTMPAHMNWQLMGNLCCFAGPPSAHLLDLRAASGARIVRRLRALGITPVLPGYFGLVPSDFARRYPAAHIVAQGSWGGFQRPAWLDPRDPLFRRIAAIFYDEEARVFGDGAVYDMEPFQEGGTAGDVPVGAAAAAIQAALRAAHPGARWLTLGWGRQPDQRLLAGVDRSGLLVVDLEQNTVPHDDRATGYQGAPFLFGGLWDFGGRTLMGGEAQNYGVRLPGLHRTQPGMVGTAVFPEGMDNNPYMFQLFTEAAWRPAPVDLAAWTRAYADRRYGGPDPHVREAWQILLQTVYAMRPAGLEDNGQDRAPQESLFNAQPDLAAIEAFAEKRRPVHAYDMNRLPAALAALLEAAPARRRTETYRYDVVDLARQVMANEARILLPRIRSAYQAGDRAAFDRLTATWLSLMALQDRLLDSIADFRVATWLGWTRGWAQDKPEADALDYDARSILTDWGTRQASQSGLHDYANRDWSGLTRDYYMRRWRMFFASLDRSLALGRPPMPIDWFAVGEQWNRDHAAYPAAPRGDPVALARRALAAVEAVR